MSDTPTKIVVDCSTGEVQELPLTAEEIAQRSADAEAFAAEQAAREAEQAAIAAARESANAKLTSLGLTQEEIQALIK